MLINSVFSDSISVDSPIVSDSTVINNTIMPHTDSGITMFSQITDFISLHLTFILMGTIVLLFVIIGFLIYSLIHNKNRAEKLEHRLNNYKNDLDSKLGNYSISNNRYSKNTSLSLETLSKKIVTLEKQLHSSTSETNSLIKEINSKLNILTNHIEKTTTRTEETKKPNNPISKKEIFFSKPEQDESFDIYKLKEQSAENINKVSYKITFKHGSETGVLEYISNIKDKSNVDHREETLEPACQILNPDHHPVNKIDMIEPGMVEKQGNKWVVINKVQVQFK